MILGQDESTFHQYIFANRTWKNISGYNQIVPKSVGDLLMISGYQSRETGLGFSNDFDDDVLEKINDKRCGQKYISADEIIIVYNQKTKHILDFCALMLDETVVIRIMNLFSF